MHDFMKDNDEMKIEFTTSPKLKDISCLTDGINNETPEYDFAKPFGFFVRDENGRIIAGANGVTVYGSIYTDQLWVDVDHRNQGLGRQLMEKVHELGRSSGCSLATLVTMDFQGAIHFYKKLGYIIDFERNGYVNNSKTIFMKKSL